MAVSPGNSLVSFYFYSPGFSGSQAKYSMLGLMGICFQGYVWGKVGDWEEIKAPAIKYNLGFSETQGCFY